MKKILISDKLAEAGINYLNEQSGIQIHIETGLNEEGLCKIIGDYDALLIRSDTQVTQKVLQAAKRLKLIGRAGIGVDNVDIPAATEMGVIVMNTPDANATTTAELAIAHLMSLSRYLPKADRSVSAGKWERSKLMGSEAAPEGTLLVTRHDDRPGVISAISAVLSNADINITRMQGSTADDQQQAMAVMSVSEPVNEALLQQLCSIAAVHQATQINL
jgi:predicted amino acid-binding ACT domain protein